jgi:hypothetical protein
MLGLTAAAVRCWQHPGAASTPPGAGTLGSDEETAMSDPDDVALPAAFSSVRVERVVRDDGRYVIYFSWPQERLPPSERAGAGPASAATSQPWNVSSGPPDEREPRV